MSDVSAQEVMKLRKATGAGMMDAKGALREAEGDFEAAKDLLRRKGLADAKKRSDRASTQGTIGNYLHYQSERPVVGTLVELRCETDFVAKSPEFGEAAKGLAMHVAAKRPQWLDISDVPSDVVAKEQEIAAEQARDGGKPENVIHKIVDGKLAAFYKDNVMLQQPFVNPEQFDGTVGALVDDLRAKMGENVTIGKFYRIDVSEADE